MVAFRRSRRHPSPVPPTSPTSPASPVSPISPDEVAVHGLGITLARMSPNTNAIAASSDMTSILSPAETTINFLRHWGTTACFTAFTDFAGVKYFAWKAEDCRPDWQDHLTPVVILRVGLRVCLVIEGIAKVVWDIDARTREWKAAWAIEPAVPELNVEETAWFGGDEGLDEFLQEVMGRLASNGGDWQGGMTSPNADTIEDYMSRRGLLEDDGLDGETVVPDTEFARSSLEGFALWDNGSLETVLRYAGAVDEEEGAISASDGTIGGEEDEEPLLSASATG